jgi:ureidoacrylate peracid hydrolase
VDTALLMIDLHNSYYATDGWRAALGYPDIWRLDETVAECVALMDACRASGIPVIYTKGANRADGADRMPRYAEAYAKARAALPPMSPEHQAWKSGIMDVAAPKPGDIVVAKPRWCAFQYTELDAILRNLGTTRLMVAGLQTNVCVETTVRSALMRNFVVAVPEDAVSTDGDDLHHHGLQAMKILYAEVAPWRDLLSADVPWDRAFTIPNYGRNPSYWDETAVGRDETPA